PFCSFLSLSLLRLPLCPTLLPYTTLFRSVHVGPDGAVPRGDPADEEGFVGAHRTELTPDVEHVGFGADVGGGDGVDRSGGSGVRDRKSTRLNSSHVKISYAGFCLKKKRKD